MIVWMLCFIAFTVFSFEEIVIGQNFYSYNPKFRLWRFLFAAFIVGSIALWYLQVGGTK